MFKTLFSTDQLCLENCDLPSVPVFPVFVMPAGHQHTQQGACCIGRLKLFSNNSLDRSNFTTSSGKTKCFFVWWHLLRYLIKTNWDIVSNNWGNNLKNLKLIFLITYYKAVWKTSHNIPSGWNISYCLNIITLHYSIILCFLQNIILHLTLVLQQCYGYLTSVQGRCVVLINKGFLLDGKENIQETLPEFN